MLMLFEMMLYSSHYGSLERNNITGKQEWTGELLILWHQFGILIIAGLIGKLYQLPIYNLQLPIYNYQF